MRKIIGGRYAALSGERDERGGREMRGGVMMSPRVHDN